MEIKLTQSCLHNNYSLIDLEEIFESKIEKLARLSKDMTEAKAADLELELTDLLRIVKERQI